MSDIFTIKCYDAEGYECILSLSNGTSEELMSRAGLALNWLKTNGFTPSRPELPVVSSPAATPRPSAPPPPPPPPPPRPAQQEEEALTFPAERLVYGGPTKSGGQVFWKVYGGRFSQHGVPIYKEALEQALAAGCFIEDELIPETEYPLTGLTAHYIPNEAGNPKKVVRLSR